MKIAKFEDIIAWQKSRDLTLAVYGAFRNIKDFSFRDQIQRASVSVMNNIAEGFERKGNKEFGRFLCISNGSCGEVRSMLYSRRRASEMGMFLHFHFRAEELIYAKHIIPSLGH